MTEHIIKNRAGFGWGYSEITRCDESTANTGINLGIRRLRQGETYKQVISQETAWLLLNGKAMITVNNESIHCQRQSLFHENPSCVHLCKAQTISIDAESELEFLECSVPNEKLFPISVYTPNNIRTEQRGKGWANDTCERTVRTIFDNSNSHENTELVLGEVVNAPGKWSSYPPHHHKQPEIYHYRFDHAQGYGHAELDDRVFKIKQFDSLKIVNEQDHAQCAAPGYAMYYAWVIRHLPDNRYSIPIFTPEHQWVMKG